MGSEQGMIARLLEPMAVLIARCFIWAMMIFIFLLRCAFGDLNLMKALYSILDRADPERAMLSTGAAPVLAAVRAMLGAKIAEMTAPPFTPPAKIDAEFSDDRYDDF